MKTNLPESIKTYDQAERFLTDLFNNGELWHPDDDPHDLVWNNLDNAPTKEEEDKLEELMNQCHNVTLDPCGICCNLDNDWWVKTALKRVLKYIPDTDTELLSDVGICLERLDHIQVN